MRMRRHLADHAAAIAVVASAIVLALIARYLWGLR